MRSYDIKLEVLLKTPKMGDYQKVSTANMMDLYWTPAQQLTHHTVTGCNMQVGDMLGSGTISGKEKGTYGSLLEITWGGKEPMTLEGGESRVFLQDGDSVILRGYCQGEGYVIGFGDCEGTISPALEDSEFF